MPREAEQQADTQHPISELLSPYTTILLDNSLKLQYTLGTYKCWLSLYIHSTNLYWMNYENFACRSTLIISLYRCPLRSDSEPIG